MMTRLVARMTPRQQVDLERSVKTAVRMNRSTARPRADSVRAALTELLRQRKDLARLAEIVREVSEWDGPLIVRLAAMKAASALCELGL